jgi:hypothetical protein
MMTKPMTGNRFSAADQVAKALKVLAGAGVVVLIAACTPTVKVATDEPITINLNVNIKHEILGRNRLFRAFSYYSF